MFKKLKSIFASVWRGIKRVARWVARMFGYKADTRFGRILWYVFATCACILALYAAIETVKAYVTVAQWNREARRQQQPDYCHDYWNTKLSHGIIYHDEYDRGYVYNKRLGRRTVTDISWIRESEDGDDLVCYSNGQRRGYFNRTTGELAIPPKYEKAWIFSEGLACVELNGSLGFIDHDGNLVIDTVFERSPYIGNYCFHNGLCLMIGDNGRTGLIDKQGNWAVEPVYSYMDRLYGDFWKVRDTCGYAGLLDKSGQFVLPCEYANVEIYYNTKSIYVTTLTHVSQIFDFEGNMINSCDFEAIEQIKYVMNDYDESGPWDLPDPICLRYRSSDHYYGLMDQKGNVITPPLYFYLEAIAPDRFYCRNSRGAVIIDDKGKECGEKL